MAHSDANHNSKADFQESKKWDKFKVNDHITNIHAPETLKSYLHHVRNAPMLSEEAEYKAAKEWQHSRDPKAKDALIKSHMRLLHKIARGYKAYGLSHEELVAEGHIGMMQALNGFDPERGVRFSTYVSLWIKAAIKDYAMRSFSMVRTGTNNAQKKLFFRLRSLKHKLLQDGQEHLTDSQVENIAKELEVPVRDVKEMDKRLSRSDYSLNRRIRSDEEGEWQDWLASETECHSDQIAHKDELEKRTEMLHQALATLKEREREIIKKRRLTEPPVKLEQLAQEFNLSAERIRQIDVRAFTQLQERMRIMVAHA